MVARIQDGYTKARRKCIAAMGDSLTHNYTLMVPPHLAWPERLAARLRADGYGVLARNFAISGNTTTQMRARIGEMLAYDTPTIAIIFGGVNDPAGAITGATTTANLVAMARYLRNGCAGQVAGQANLPAHKLPGARYLVVSDTSANGGLAQPTGATYATASGAVTGPTIWECRNGLAGESGWSRVADYPAAARAVDRIILVSPQYLNYTSGGDALDLGGTHSGQGATYAGVDTAVRNAATTLGAGAVYADLYVYLQQRIIDGWDADNSASWHVDTTNQHFTAYGWDLVAQFVKSVIAAQSGWLTALEDG